MKNFYKSILNFKVFSGTPLFELGALVVLALLSGFIARIPLFFDLDADWFYPRNISFVALPSMAAYFMVRVGLEWKRAVGVAAVFVLSAVYINLLPGDDSSDTLVLAFIHLPFFLWAVVGYVFVRGRAGDDERVSAFLRFNGDLAVIAAVMVIAGGILTVITIGLFELIELDIEKFYFNYIAIWGLAAVPVVGAYLVLNNPKMVRNVSPVIARIFTPLVLVMLVVYLGAIVYTGKDPYNDREFLLVFNILLVGVMALILFSVAEFPDSRKSQEGSSKRMSLNALLLFVLSVVTIVTNGIALSAILFRISEWGITPNRLAVLGSNLLILLNLIMVASRLFIALRKNEEMTNAERAITSFMPFYTLWIFIVTFIFPVIFEFV